jgi:hypothetical protein
MHHRKSKVVAPTAAATTITPQQQEEGQSHTSSSSSYNPRRLKLYTPAEIEHCETSKTIMKYIDAKTIQDKNTGITYKTQMQSFAQFVYRRYGKTPVDNFLEQISLILSHFCRNSSYICGQKTYARSRFMCKNSHRHSLFSYMHSPS